MSFLLRFIPLFFGNSASTITTQKQQTTRKQLVLEEAQHERPQEQQLPTPLHQQRYDSDEQQQEEAEGPLSLISNIVDHNVVLDQRKRKSLAALAEKLGSMAAAVEYFAQFERIKEEAILRRQCGSDYTKEDNVLSPEDAFILQATKELNLEVRQVKAIFGIGSGRYERIVKKSRPKKKIGKVGRSTVKELEYFIEKNLCSPDKKNRTLFLRYQQKENWRPKDRNFDAPLITNNKTFYWNAKRAMKRIESRCLIPN